MNSKTCMATWCGCVAFTAGMGGAAVADIVISHGDLPSGQSTAQFSFVDGAINTQVDTLGGNFAPKTVQGVSGMGISGGPVHGEIAGDQEMIFTFDQPVLITSIEIAHLYTAGNFGDIWNEVALFRTDIGDFFLEASSPSTGDWSGFGDLTNVSYAQEGFGGAWRVAGEDIFGGPITSLTLMSGNAGNHHKYGDFSFVNLQAAQLPAPGALVVMAFAIAAGRIRRR